MHSTFWRLPFDIRISSCLLSQAKDRAPLVAKWHVPGMVAHLEHTEGTWTCLQVWAFIGEAATSFSKQDLA